MKCRFDPTGCCYGLNGQTFRLLFDPVALTLKLQHRASVHQPIEHSAGHGITQILAPVLQHPVAPCHAMAASAAALASLGTALCQASEVASLLDAVQVISLKD